VDDAKNYFIGYTGEETYEDYYLSYYEYKFNLWNDEGRECTFDDYGNGWVEFWYNATYSLDDAKAFHTKLMQRVKDCMPSNYSLSETESEYSLVYYKFSDDRDRDNLDKAAYPQIEVTIEEKEDFYYCAITISNPYDH